MAKRKVELLSLRDCLGHNFRAFLIFDDHHFILLEDSGTCYYLTHYHKDDMGWLEMQPTRFEDLTSVPTHFTDAQTWTTVDPREGCLNWRY